MALGYCKVCDRLVPIKLAVNPWAGASAKPLDEVRQNQDRAAVWQPDAHDGPDGRPCPGARRPV